METSWNISISGAFHGFPQVWWPRLYRRDGHRHCTILRLTAVALDGVAWLQCGAVQLQQSTWGAEPGRSGSSGDDGDGLKMSKVQCCLLKSTLFGQCGCLSYAYSIWMHMILQHMMVFHDLPCNVFQHRSCLLSGWHTSLVLWAANGCWWAELPWFLITPELAFTRASIFMRCQRSQQILWKHVQNYSRGTMCRPDFCIFIAFSDMYFRRIVLFPPDWLGMLRILHMDTVASCISMKPEDQNALMAWRLVNWVRCLAEDLPQCFFQSLSSIWVNLQWD